MEVNEKNLSRPEIEGKFSYAKNTINYMRVLDSLDNDCTYENFSLPASNETSFVTMGRLSTERRIMEILSGHLENMLRNILTASFIL
ncbi:MAG: hypothetical protein ACLRR3_01330 [Eubacterium sp.]